MQFVKFMTSSKGRAARVIAGLVILTVGLAVVQGTLGLILALIALIILALMNPYTEALMIIVFFLLLFDLFYSRRTEIARPNHWWVCTE